MKRIHVLGALACLASCLVPLGPCSAAVRINGALSGPSVPEPFSVEPGDSLSSVFIDELSEVDVRGGTIINFEATFSRDTLRLNDNARVNVSGGLFQMKTRPGVTFGTSALYLEDRSEATVTGGRFEAFGSLDYVINLHNDSSATIWGGEFVGKTNHVIHMFSRGRLSIRGGTFTAVSSFDYELNARSGVTDIFARSATLDGQPVAFGPLNVATGTHTLSLVYRDGTSEDLTFRQRGGQMNLIQVPEPASGLLVCWFAWVWLVSRRR